MINFGAERSRLLLLNDLGRSRLILLRESDEELRRLERASISNPDDTELQQRLSRHRRRVGPPDTKHNWRWNGKGWFTRPQWNDGRCPGGSQPTQHNTCIDDSDRDRAHYVDKGPPKGIEIPPNATHYHRERLEKAQARAERGRMIRSPGVADSPLDIKPGNKVNWEHPYGPRIYVPYENEKPRPLPDNPEHLPSGLARAAVGYPGSYTNRASREQREKLVKHYTGKGFDEKYVRSALGSREDNPPWDWYPGTREGLPDKDLARLPDRKSRIRALRKKGVKDRRRREAEAEAERQNYIAMYGEDPGDFNDYDDERDYDYDYERGFYDDDSPVSIGGYKNHPGYPGHPDFPQFDAYRADHENDPRPRGRWHSRWDPLPPEPADAESDVVEPTSRSGQPRWPRTGRRMNPHELSNERFRLTRGPRGRRPGRRR